MHPSPNLDQPQALACSQCHSSRVFVARLVQLVALGLSLALVAVALPGCIDQRTPPKTHATEQGRSFGGARPAPVDGGSVDLGNQMGAPWLGGSIQVPSPVSPQGESVTDISPHQKSDAGKPVLREEEQHCVFDFCVSHKKIQELVVVAAWGVGGVLWGLLAPMRFRDTLAFVLVVFGLSVWRQLKTTF